MDEVLKRRVIGAAVLIGAGVLIPVLVVKMATPSAPPTGESVTVYEITPSGETRPVSEKQSARGGESGSQLSTAKAPSQAPAPDGLAADTQTEPAQAPAAQTQTPPPKAPPKAEVQPQPAPPPKPDTTPEPEPKPQPRPEPAKPAPEPEKASQQAPPPAPTPATKQTVPVQASPPEPDSDKPYFVVQVGSFGEEANAIQLTQDLRRDFPVFYREGEVSGKKLYRVRVGPFDSHEAADIVGARLREKGLKTQTLTLP